jgi:molybdopterin-containing oxidoreductase family iron-sulfur binding subunit
MANTKKYWKGLEQLEDEKNFSESNKNEFAETLPAVDFLEKQEVLEEGTTSRRDFLKYLGFGVAAASLAACETPVTKAIPYIIKPEDVTPGVANHYASTYYDGNDYCSVLIKTREGRPIFVKGNTLSSLTKGEINARVNSSVLSLYDNNRIKSPLINGEESSWSSIDNRLGQAIKSSKNIQLLTQTVISPSEKKLINTFLQGGASPENSKRSWIQHDAISYSGMLDANLESFGVRVIPTYNFDKAKTIVSIGADFLSGWLDSIQYNVGYAVNRSPEKDWMSKHFQFEANMSLTGTNCDVRVPVKPSQYSSILTAIYNSVAKKLGNSKVSAAKLDAVYSNRVAEVTNHLLQNKGESIIICSSNDKDVQIIVNALNSMLNNYGSTIDLIKNSNSKQGSDAEMLSLIEDMEAGKVDALLINGIDPVFTYGDRFKKAMSKVKTTVSFAPKMNETTALCGFVCPDNNFLESWSDAEPVKGHFSLGQPTISPLFNTRQFQESLMVWTGEEGTYHDYIKAFWEENIFTNTNAVMFADFWNNSLHDGVIDIVVNNEATPKFAADVNTSANLVSKRTKPAGDFELTLYIKEGIGHGVGADNPVLQELPDPVSKITWDNYVTMNPTEMQEKGYNTIFGQENPANLIAVTVGSKTIELPVIAQPGQTRGTIGIALGYGKAVGNMKEITGVNAYPLVSTSKTGSIAYTTSATIADLEGTYPIAAAQTQQTVMGRDSVVRETTIDTYKKGNREEFNPIWTLLSADTDDHGHQIEKPLEEFDLWGDQPVKNIGHRWGMSIDMNLCTGCGACVTACNLENNVAVIGKDEVRRGRIMHWLRIDRYYSSEHQPLGDIGGTLDATRDAEDIGTISAYSSMENPADNPTVVHQPMMCQHCNHAGCETVCPVAATTHSNEGLNQMTYNRCIGTRYCANNCAYKVRRFNWYNYVNNSKFVDINPSQDDLGRMVLNPDVVVRSRGVMEKCSFCIQGIQAAKLEAKKEGRPVRDGDVDCACSSVCGSEAIIFGDLNDTESKVRAGMEKDRAYRVIEEVGQDANVYYQTKVRNLKA